MAGCLHEQLVDAGAKWLTRSGFGVVATEVSAIGVAEEPDAIGFRSTCSAVIEAKATRADFLADSKKLHRRAGGLGVYRFYISPVGVIAPEDLPAGRGLLHAIGRRVVEVVRPRGNLWPSYGAAQGDWASFQHRPDEHAESRVLYSIARRRSLSRSDERYEKMLRDAARENQRLARRNDELAARIREFELAPAGLAEPVTAENSLAAIRSKSS